MITILESPYAATTREGLDANAAYLNECLRDSLRRGEHPYASHAYLTRVLDDGLPGQRARGLQAGHAVSKALLQAGARQVFYIDRGVSAGMALAFDELWHLATEEPVLRSAVYGREIALTEVFAANLAQCRAATEAEKRPSTPLRVCAEIALAEWRCHRGNHDLF